MNLFTLWNHNGFGLALLVSFLEKSIEEMGTTMYYYSLFALGFSIDVLARRGNQTQKHRWFFPYAKTYTNFQGDCKLFFYVVE